MSIISRVKNFRQNNKAAFIAILAVVAFVVIIVVLSLVAHQSDDNHKLSSEEKSTQTNIQTDLDDNTVRLVKIDVNTAVDNGSWQLVTIDSVDNTGNYAAVILKDGKVALGPGSNFPIDELYNNSVPSEIIDYLYPDKPHWVNFDSVFQDGLKNSQTSIKAVIEAYAYVNSIQLDKVTRVSDVTKQTLNPNSENMTGVVEFKFTINNSADQYTYRSSYLVDTAQYTNQIIDASGNVVYTSTISG